MVSEAVTYRRILNDIKNGKKPPLEVWISEEERLLYTFWADPKKPGVQEMLSKQAYENLKLLNEIINDIFPEISSLKVSLPQPINKISHAHDSYRPPVIV